MRIRFGAVSLAFAAGLMTAGVPIAAAPSQAGPTPARAAQPNIVLILTDDQAAADFAHMPLTQALLGNEGTTFTNFIASVALCCPSRASILRGQYAHNHGVLKNNSPDGGYQTFLDSGHEESTIGTWLQAAGYRTGFYGKYLNGYLGDQHRVAPGWDDWQAGAGPAAYGQFGYRMNENGRLVSYGREPSDYGTDVLARKVTAFVQESTSAGRPFFAYVAPYAPHNAPPFAQNSVATVAPRHAGLFEGAQAPRTPSFDEASIDDKPAYVRERPRVGPVIAGNIDRAFRARLQSLQAVDELVAGVIGTLDDAGALANTYVFYTSDNGWMQGQHRIPGEKQVPYEESIRVSMRVRGPGMAAGQTLDHLVGNIDLAPTFAELAGVPLPGFVDGRSLTPLFGGAPSTPEWRQAFLIEHWLDGEVNEPRFPIPDYVGLRTMDAVYVEYTTGEREFYDLRSDPYQMDNLASGPDGGRLGPFADRLAVLKGCAGAGCREVEDGPAPSLASHEDLATAPANTPDSR